jgi:hypothetical protein
MAVKAAVKHTGNCKMIMCDFTTVIFHVIAPSSAIAHAYVDFWSGTSHINALYQLLVVSQGSSVTIVSDYGLDNWAIQVRSQAQATDFSSSLCVQTSSAAHSASRTMGIVDAK